MSVCHRTVENFLEVTANNLESETENILNDIRNKQYVHADETGISVNGKNAWIWAIATTCAVYFKIH